MVYNGLCGGDRFTMKFTIKNRKVYNQTYGTNIQST